MNDFLVTKLFNISAATPVVIMSILSFIMFGSGARKTGLLSAFARSHGR